MPLVDGLRSVARLDELRLRLPSKLKHRRIEGNSRHHQPQRHQRQPKRLRAVPVPCLQPRGEADERDHHGDRNERWNLPRCCRLRHELPQHQRECPEADRDDAKPGIGTRHRPADKRGAQQQHATSQCGRVPHDQANLQRQPRRAPRMQRKVEQIERRARERVAQERLVDGEQHGQTRADSDLKRDESGSGAEAGDAAAAMPAAETPRLDRVEQQRHETAGDDGRHQKVEWRRQEGTQERRRVIHTGKEGVFRPVGGWRQPQ